MVRRPFAADLTPPVHSWPVKLPNLTKTQTPEAGQHRNGVSQQPGLSRLLAQLARNLKGPTKYPPGIYQLWTSSFQN
jgi:hypothetical protein